MGVRRRAVSLIAELNTDDEDVLRLLEKCVDDADDRTSQLAISFLARQGDFAIPVFRTVLENGTHPQRSTVLKLLPSTGFDPRNFEDALRILLPKPEFAQNVLGYVRTQSPAWMQSWISVIREFMQTADGDNRLSAAFTLGKLEPGAVDAIGVLLEALSIAEHRPLAATFLNWIGYGSIQTLVPLIEALIDEDDGTCWEINGAIANIEDRNAVCNEISAAVIHQSSVKIRRELIRILPGVFSDAGRSSETESLLIRILKDACLRVRLEAVIQLLKLNATVPDLPALIQETFESSDEQARRSLLKLARHTQSHDDRHHLLNLLRQDSSPIVAEEAAWELSKPWANLNEEDLTPEL